MSESQQFLSHTLGSGPRLMFLLFCELTFIMCAWTIGLQSVLLLFFVAFTRFHFHLIYCKKWIYKYIHMCVCFRKTKIRHNGDINVSFFCSFSFSLRSPPPHWSEYLSVCILYSAFLSGPDLRFLRYFSDVCDMAFCSSHSTVMDIFFFFVCLLYRSLTSNLPNVNLPNVNLQIPKVPNLPVPVAGLSVNLPQMPSFSTPSWMAAIYDSECVFN